jgi:ABC-type Fe3+/spermidine/putrescine transport system ATPase subunit
MISVKKLTRQFDKRGIAGLHDLSFNLNKGQILGIMGPNGSGKTTLLKILAGEINQDAGDISIDGSVSVFSQNESIENINVQKFLINSVNLDISEEKKVQLARDLADTFEFTFQLRQNFHELSSGQRQKILLAKELINRPALLLMDEPFSHLDPFTRRDILNGLFQYIKHQGVTVLWVTHDLEEAFLYSDLIGLMQFGKFEQLDTPEIMVRKPKNLFSAKFMGYRNFFSVKSSSGVDSILIVPDHAWEINPAGTAYTVKARHAGKQITEYTLFHESKSIFFIRGSQLPLIDIGSVVNLSPISEECFHIPL